jgi:replication factor C small subunit
VQEKIPQDQITPDDIELVVKSAHGDLRRAIMLLQVFVELPGHRDLSEITVSETTNLIARVIKFLRDKDVQSAQKTVESLLIDYGLTCQEVLRELSRTVEKDYNDPRLTIQIAATDEAILQSGNEFIQLNALLARMLYEVFDEKSSEALR